MLLPAKIDNAIEIERRWRFFGPTGLLEPLKGIYTIQQYYLSVGLKLHCIGLQYFLAVKSKSSELVGRNWEVEIPYWVYDQLLRYSPDALHIDKIRSQLALVDESDLTVDIYVGVHRGLIILGRKCLSVAEASAFDLPVWLQEYCQEITQYPEYTNYALARAGKLPDVPISI